MISKKELMLRLCDVESDIEFLYEHIDKLEKKVKKFDKPIKPTKKVKKDDKMVK